VIVPPVGKPVPDTSQYSRLRPFTRKEAGEAFATE